MKSKSVKRFLRIAIIIEIILIISSIIVLFWPRHYTFVDTPSTSAGWGDSGGGRPSYTIEEINEGALGNKIVFNSISNGNIGDEKNFVGAQEEACLLDNSKDYYEGNEIAVEDGKIYRIRLYVHNNSLYGEDSVAENVGVAFSIPWNTGKELPVYGFIFSDNASPNEYWDGVMLRSDQYFHLEYIKESAIIENNGFASLENGGPKVMSDEIVTSPDGILIGYNGFDGRIPGCFQYDCAVSLLVKVVFDCDFSVECKARLAGEENWSYNVDANIGDQVEIQIHYKNTDSNDQVQNDVMIRDILPENLQYVPGTITLYNANYEDGIVAKGENLFNQGVDIGSYGKNSNGYIRFKAEIVDKSLEPGSNTLVNWAQCGVGEKTINDYATVTINKTE